MTGRDPTSDLGPHIAEPLRATEQLSSAVAQHVMDVVRAEGARRYPPVDAAASLDQPTARWWRRRSIQLSPAVALAWAAGLVAIASAATLRAVAARREPSTNMAVAVAAPARPETVHVVRFVFRDPAARQVAIVGDFNAWMKGATPLAATGEHGAWAVSVRMPTGRHEYAFIVDGERWSPDPFAARVADEFGTESSVVTVGDVVARAGDAPRGSD